VAEEEGGQPAATGTGGVANVVDANTRTLRLSDMALLSIRRAGSGRQGARAAHTKAR